MSSGLRPRVETTLLPHDPRTYARLYFALQATAGATWWFAVAVSPFARTSTLGTLDPVPVAALDIPLFVVASAIAAFGIRPAAWVATVWTGVVLIALAIYATSTTLAGPGVVLMAAATGGSLAALSLLVLGRIPTEWITKGPFGFRLAKATSSSGAYVLATFAQIVVMWGFFLGMAPVIIRWLEVRWQLELPLLGALPIAGLVLLVLASALGIWSALSMSIVGRGTPLPSAMPQRLVIAGPYRFVRNPMAIAGITQGVAVGLMLSSWLVVAYALAGSLLWNYAVRPLEEADLEHRFGDDFRSYRSRTRCWIPSIPVG